jgi:uncharacterized cofD-like protein
VTAAHCAPGRVVALGGGHGLAVTLRAVRAYASEITAIVSVADDGGSSGRLRDSLGGPAPGDVRRCLVALAREPSLLARAFEHRFGAGELEGHALGNLVLAALAEVTGDYVAAIDEAGRMLGACGRVLPATTEAVVLEAEAGAAEVKGQVAVSRTHGVTSVSLSPPDPPAPQPALDALAAADQVVLGPGSLYTSVLAVAAVPAIRAALAATGAHKVYVCNLRPQPPETDGYDVADHVDALRSHGVDVDVVLCHPAAMPLGDLEVPFVEQPIARPDLSAHDPALLGVALAALR